MWAELLATAFFLWLGYVVVARRDWWTKMGYITGVILLILANFVPLTFIEPMSAVAPQSGPRLYVGSVHVHHWMIGAGLVAVGAATGNGFLVGLGSALVMDQAYNLITGRWGP